MSQIKLIAEGRRIYLSGNTFPIKEKIKAAGGHWDGDRKMWWVGSQARAEFEAIAASAPTTEYVPAPLDHNSRVYGKARYKGRAYFVVTQGKNRMRLTVLDASIDFWARNEDCEWLKTYQPRSRFAGYGRGNVEVYTTLGSLRDFIAESKAAEKEIAAGQIPVGYARDLEDGGIKRISECDMPSDGRGGVL
jgi:hypothetical protein